MPNEIATIIGSSVELAEHANYIELTNRVCYYDFPNLNGACLKYGTTKAAKERTLKKAETLKNMPVQAKYVISRNGEPTLGGHEVQLVNGKPVFGTASIGTHEDVWISEEDVLCPDGETRTLPCLYAKARIWNRYENCVAAVKRLFSVGELKSSWEIDCTKYSFEDGVKTLEDYEFLANCLLDGATHPPAYPNAGALNIASEEVQSEWMVAEALGEDMNLIAKSEVNDMAKEEMLMAEEETEVLESTEVAEPDDEPENDSDTNDTGDTDNTGDTGSTGDAGSTDGAGDNGGNTQEDAPAGDGEGSDETETTDETPEADDDEKANNKRQVVSGMVTDRDFRCMLEGALATKTDPYPWVCYVFSVDRKCWYKNEECEHELDFVEANFDIIDDGITITERNPICLVAAPRGTAELLAQKDQEIAELLDIKAKYETEMEKQQKEAHDKAMAELVEYAAKSGCFTEEEMESAEMKELFNNVSVNEVKALVADKLMAQKESAEQKPVKDIAEARPKMGMSYDDTERAKERKSQWQKFVSHD